MKSYATRLKAKALRVLHRDSPPLLQQEKLNIIDFAFTQFKFRSFADLGAVWRVNAGYTFHTLEKFDISSAFIVDTHPTDIVRERAGDFPQLKIIQGNFGDEAVARKVGEVDAVFLFDVLLHQVSPDWDRILEIYAEHTKCFIILNQQWIGSDCTVRLLDLGEDEYFNNVPVHRTEGPYDGLYQKLDSIHPDHDRPWRDVHHIWQWGITDADLTAKVESLGFERRFMKNCGQFGSLKNFEDHAFVFTK